MRLWQLYHLICRQFMKDAVLHPLVFLKLETQIQEELRCLQGLIPLAEAEPLTEVVGDNILTLRNFR